MKRKSLAFLLALIMILTLVPASAFAATDNTVTKVPTVASEANMPWATLNMVVKDATGIDVGADQVIKVTIENGTWAMGDAATKANLVSTTAALTAPVTTAGIIATASGTTTLTAEVIAFGDNYAEFILTPGVAALAKESGYISLSFGIKSGEEAGDVKVKVESIDSQISSGTYTVGIVSGGKTVATVSGKVKKTGRVGDVESAAIEIREVAVNSVKAGTQSITLTLPKGVEWNANTTLSGNMFAAGATATVSTTDARDLVVTGTANGDPNLREVLVVTPHIDILKDAKLGDIAVQVRPNSGSDITKATGLVIANYTEEEVVVSTVKEKDLPEIYAGFVNDGTDDYEVEVTIEEASVGSLIAGKYIDFEFPEWVQIVSPGGVEVALNGSDIAGYVIAGNEAKDTSSFEYKVPTLLTNKTNKLVFTIPVTVEAGHTGDLELVVSGAKAGLSETKLVVAKLAAPITGKVEISDVRLGVQNQAGGKIVLTETEVGAIREGKLEISISNLGFANSGMKFKDAKVEVTGGDLEIKNKVDISSAGLITVTVDRASIKDAAEITVSDVQITLDRTLPAGAYKVNVKGVAVIDNAAYNDGDFKGNAYSADYVNIVTPADLGANAKFVIGNKEYTSNNVNKTMDVAPYIDGANRTMMPIRYVAEAMGLTENQIVWDQATQTATIFGEKVVTIKMGSNQLVAGGTPVTMDTVAVNKDSRIFVPARFVANALGASVEWDAATKTVTIFTVK